VRSVAAALVGTRLPVERADTEVERLVREGSIVQIGRDALGLPRYSNKEMLAVERDVVATAQNLARSPWRSVDAESLADRCRVAGLTAEQRDAVFAATAPSAVVIIEGAPGAGNPSPFQHDLH
jgi:hypothetical protein